MRTGAELARDFLETLQREAHNALGLEPWPEHDEVYWSQIAELKGSTYLGNKTIQQQVHAFKKKLFEDHPPSTIFERRDDFAILAHRYEVLLAGVAKSGGTLPPALVGTLPSGSVNSHAYAVPDSNYHVITFQQGVFRFLNLCVKVLVLAMPVQEENGILLVKPESISQRLETSRELNLRFSDMLEAYVIDGEPANALPYIREIPGQEHLEFLLPLSELFLLCHEFGHIVLDHSGMAERHVSIEFAADRKGMDLLLQCGNISSNPMFVCHALWSVTVVMAAQDVVEQAVAVLRTGMAYVDRGQSHPSPWERVTKLYETVSPSVPIALRPILSVVTQLMFSVIQELWKRMLPAYVRLHKQGTRPAVIFGSDLGTERVRRAEETWAKWMKKILAGMESQDAQERAFFGDYFDYFAIEIASFLYDGVLSNDQRLSAFCAETLIKIEPLYNNYPIGEKVRHAKERGGLDNLIGYLSGTMAHIARSGGKLPRTVDD